MGRKGRWFSSVKKALNPESKDKKDQKPNKSKTKWFGKENLQASEYPSESVSSPPPQHPPPDPPRPEERNAAHLEKENGSAHPVAVATTAYVEKAVSATLVASVAVQSANMSKYVGKDKAEIAATQIQTAFRRYLARRKLRALRGLVRIKSLMEGPAVRRQVISTLKSMHTSSRVQSQIQARRIRMVEENQALQKQLLQKAKELESMRIGEDWDDSLQSKEQIEVKLLNKYEAAMRRERALAYAFTHQQSSKNPSCSAKPTFMDPTNPSWGWSWLERWTAARPLKELNNERLSKKSGNHSNGHGGGEISKSYARYQLNSDKFSPPSSQRATSPRFQSHSAPPKTATGTLAKKLQSASPKDGLVSDDDSKSMVSMKSERHWRHSIGASSVRDDESRASSQAVPSYMVPTLSAKAKLKIQTPLATDNYVVAERSSLGTAKKRLSFPTLPAKPRRHSVPPKLESSLNSEISVGNGVVH